MTGILNILAGSISSAIKDGYFNLVSLLLPGNGTNGAQNNTFLDSSTNNFTITRNGNTTQGTFSPFSQTGWGNYFNGTNASLTYPNNTAFAFGTGAFTIEFWINGPSNDGSFILGGRSAIGTMHITTGGSGSGTTVSCLRYVGSSTITTGSTLITNNSWNHCAIVRDGSNNITLYVNGVSAGTGTDTTNYTTTSGTWYIGQNDSGSANYLQGYISNLRILKGTALYTGSFTPPTAPLTAITNTSLLTCQSNRFIDNSANAFAITVNGTPSVQAFSPFAPTAAYSAATNGGSGYFDGTGDYLSSTISAIAGTFTIEFWFYRPASGSNFCFTIGDSQTGGNTSAEVYIGTSGTVLNYWTNNAAQITGTPAPAGQWVYLAVTRDGSNVVRLYQNGTQVGGTYTQSGTLSTALRIGAEWYGGASTGSTNGYIGHFRVSNSVRTVTTIPTSPFTSDANTVFLASFTNAGIIDATGKNVLETVGNAQISTTQSKFGGSSMYFDGTGDYLTAPANPKNNLNIGDFTLEFWIYRANLTGDVDIIGCGNSSSTGYQVRNKGTTGYMQFLVVGGATITTTTGISATTWTHIAIVRSGTTVKIYINGTDGGGSGTVANSGTVTTELLVIGANRYDYSNTLNGYMDDVRITKGYARYTASFTPPTAAFATQ